MKILIFLIISLTFPLISSGQLLSSQKPQPDIIKDFSKFVFDSVYSNGKLGRIPDSIAVYTFIVDVNLKKENNSTIVSKITSNNNLVFELFPEMNKLKNFNYSKIIGNSPNLIIRLPIILFCFKPSKSQKSPSFPFNPSLKINEVSQNIFDIFQYNVASEPSFILQGPIYFAEVYNIK